MNFLRSLQTSSKNAVRNLPFDPYPFLIGNLLHKRSQTSHHAERLVQPVKKIRFVLPQGPGRGKSNKVSSCKGKAAQLWGQVDQKALR